MKQKYSSKGFLIGIVIVLCCVVVVALVVVLSMGGWSSTASAEVKNIRTNDDRLAYLSGLGWEVSLQPIATEELLIPEQFDDSYADYLKLQEDQGFDLTRYCGKRIKRYTYQLTNYPGQDEPMQIALLIYKNRVIGGQIQSASGSILHGLTLPKSGPAHTPASNGGNGGGFPVVPVAVGVVILVVVVAVVLALKKKKPAPAASSAVPPVVPEVRPGQGPEQPQTFKFCPKCGTKVPMDTAYCPKCGKQLESGEG